MPRSEPIKAVRGMRDILPAERALWRAAERGAADVARRFGYEEIVTPIIEHAELIERVGEDTDAVAKELYRFDDRGGRNLALRPEATAGVEGEVAPAAVATSPSGLRRPPAWCAPISKAGSTRGRSPPGFISSARCSATTGRRRVATASSFSSTSRRSAATAPPLTRR